jgi:hypothetical protein
LVLGALSTVYQLAALRLYAPLSDRGVIPRLLTWLGETPRLGAYVYDVRSGYEELNEKIPQRAVVQYDPAGNERRILRLYTTHQVVAANDSCDASFGGDPTPCAQVAPYIIGLFEAPAATMRWDVDKFCSFAKIDVLVVTNADPVWRMGNSWVWSREPLVSNRSFRAFRCGNRR